MYVTVFIFGRYLNIMRPTAMADGEAGDKPGRTSLIAGGSRPEPNTLTADQVRKTNETSKWPPWL